MSKSGGHSGDRRNAWKRGSSDRLGAHRGAVPAGRWQRQPAAKDDLARQRAQLLFQRIGLTAGALSLVGLLVWMFWDTKPAVPLILAVISDHPAPLGPAVLGAADRDAIRTMGSGRAALGRGTVHPIDVSDRLEHADARAIRETLCKELAKARGGGPGRSSVIIYLAGFGAVDRDGHACLLPPRMPGAELGDADRSWLRMSDLLAALAAVERRPANVLLIVDACRQAHGEWLGINDGGFAAAAAVDAPEAAAEGIFVVVTAGPGEVSCAATTESVSVFAGAFIDGVEGCADAARDGTVSFEELGSYLGSEVERRARLRHGQRQTPFMAASGGGKKGARVSWAVRSEPLRWATQKAAPGAMADDAWLESQWQSASRLRLRAVLERPEDWARLEHSLLRVERLRGTFSPAERERMKLARDAVETLSARLADPLVQGEKLPGLRLAQLAGTSPAGVDPASRAAIDDWPNAKDSNAAEQQLAAAVDPQSWRARCDAAWQAAVARVGSNVAASRKSWDTLLSLISDRPEPVRMDPWPVELQAARLLIRGAGDDTWGQEPGTCGRVIALMDDAVRAALPDDVRADALVAAAAPRRDADRARREAFDLAAVGGIALAGAARSASEATRQYASVIATAEEVSTAWRLLDEIRAEAPWLAVWRDALARVAVDPGAGGRSEHHVWHSLLGAADRMERTLIDNPSGRGAEVVATLRNATAEAERSFRLVRDAHEAACVRLSNPSADNATTLAEIRCLLETPLIDGSRRLRLLQRERELGDQLARQDDLSKVGGETSRALPAAALVDRATAAWVQLQGLNIDPFVEVLAGDDAAAPTPRTLADVARAHAAWGQTVREHVHRAVDEENSADTPGDAGAAASRRWAMVRGAAPAGELGSSRRSLAGEQIRDRWARRLITAAQDAIDEFFGAVGSDEPEWFAAAARACLAEAEVLATARGPDERFDRLVARVRAFEATEGRWAIVENDPARLGGGGPGGTAPVTAAIKTAEQLGEGVPPGVAAAWLSPGSGDESLWIEQLSNGDSAEPCRRVGIPVARSDAEGKPRSARWRVSGRSVGLLQENGRGSLDFVVWYRGHRLPSTLRLLADGGGVPVVWERRKPKPGKITVDGRDTKHGYVSFVFDSSGSMTTDRMKTGRQAIMAVLESLAEAGAWDASVWLYGHRAAWSQKPPHDTVEFSDMGKRHRGAPPLPEDDVEAIQRMAFVTRTRLGQLRPVFDALRGWGDTPLYLAMQKALQADAAAVPAGALWRIVVLTDGVNRVTRAAAPTSSRAVIEELSMVNRGRAQPVAIDVVALDLEPRDSGERLAYEELRTLVKDAKGQWRNAQNTEQLKQAFREFLGLRRWEAVDGSGTAREAELKQGLEVPEGGHTVRIVGRRQTDSRVVIEGGEILELFTAGDDRPLEHRRYGGGTEQGIRAHQDGLDDPGDANLKWFVAAHLPERLGTRVTFPVSLQNHDPTLFSPRPVELWAEVRPGGAGGPRPFVFVDPDLEPERPVPVIDLTVTAWPKDSDKAEILVWFSPRPADATAIIPLDGMDFDSKRPFRFPELPGVTFEASLARGDAGRARLTIVERHADARDLPRLRLRLEPLCDRVVHTVEEAGGVVRHEFDIALEKGAVPPNTWLSIIGREELKEHCVKPAAPGGRMEPLRVDVPQRD